MAKVSYPDVDGSSCGTGRRREPFLEGDPDDDTSMTRFGDERGAEGRDTDENDHLLSLTELFR